MDVKTFELLDVQEIRGTQGILEVKQHQWISEVSLPHPTEDQVGLL